MRLGRDEIEAGLARSYLFIGLTSAELAPLVAAATSRHVVRGESLGTRPLTERLVLRLLELADSVRDQGTGAPATPAVSQATLAGMTGVSREHVNRALAALMAEGAIRREGSRYVLLDEDRLRRHVARDWPVHSRLDRRA